MSSAAPVEIARLSTSAAALAAARSSGQLIDHLPDSITTAEAFAIQDDTREALNERIGGWKCALPCDGRIIAAPIYASVIYSAPGPVVTRAPYIRYEPELAFTLVRDLPRGVSRDDVVAAIGETRLAVELLHGRYADVSVLSQEEVLADNLYNEGLLLGPIVPLETLIESISIEGRARAACHPSTDPLAPLVWLANEGPHPLRAGQIIITGSFIPPETIDRNATINITFGDAGSISVQFQFEKVQR